MGNDRLPNKVLCGELRCHGTKRRWRGVARLDIEAISACDRWYELCQDRKQCTSNARRG